MNPSNRIILIYSGGLDSTVLLHYLLQKKEYEVSALSFHYGQKHNRELEAAQKTCASLSISHKISKIPLDTLFQSTLLESGGDIPEGHYEEESMKQTVVPMRNLIFASIGSGYAASQGIKKIALAVHGGDHAIYPDCRSEFFDSLQKTVHLADWNEVDIEVPFVNKKKDEIVKIGIELGVDFQNTWTCYKGGEKSCGKCGSCVERLEAFEKNNENDPLQYL